MTAQELEELMNHCARQCKKLRAKLEPEARSYMDGQLSDLSPAFDMQAGLAPPLAKLLLCSLTAFHLHLTFLGPASLGTCW